MIKVSVMYPNTPGSRFDIDYYVNKHMPMVLGKVGDACKGVTIDKGLAGGAPGAAAPYVVVAHMLFESVPAFQAAFGQHQPAFGADMPNYTDVKPAVQISEVVKG
ncbi:MAG: EthD family reductase [Burkholderiales bacterium]